METQYSGEPGRQDPRTGSNPAEKVREQSRMAVEEAKAKGRGLFDEQKSVIASQADHMAAALHQAAGRLRDDGDAVASNYVDWAADGLQRMSSGLGSTDLDYMLRRTGELIRRQPVLAIGGAVLIGIAVSRFLRHSSRYPERGMVSEVAAGEPAHTAIDPLVAGASSAGQEPVEVASAPDLGEPRRTKAGLHPRAEAEYGELATRKPGAPRRGERKEGAP